MADSKDEAVRFVYRRDDRIPCDCHSERAGDTSFHLDEPQFTIRLNLRFNVGVVRTSSAGYCPTVSVAARRGTATVPKPGVAYRFSCDPVNQWVMRKDIPGEPSIRYGKLLTRLTGPRKVRKWPQYRLFAHGETRATAAGLLPLGRKRGAGRLWFSVCLFRTGTWLTAWIVRAGARHARSTRRHQARDLDPGRAPSRSQTAAPLMVPHARETKSRRCKYSSRGMRCLSCARSTSMASNPFRDSSCRSSRSWNSWEGIDAIAAPAAEDAAQPRGRPLFRPAVGTRGGRAGYPHGS